MCEDCKSNNPFSNIFGSHPLLKVLSLGAPIGIGAVPISPAEMEKAMRAFHKEYSRIPSPKELAQFILSSKSKGEKDNSEKMPSPEIEMLFNMIFGDADLNPSEKETAAVKDSKCCCNFKPIQEVSFEETVEHVGDEIKAFLSALEDKYGERIVEEALEDVVMCPEDGAITSDDIQLGLHKIGNINENLSILADRLTEFMNRSQTPTMMVGEAVALEPRSFHSQRFYTIQVLRHARKAIKQEMNNYKSSDDHYKHLESISKELKSEINCLFKQ